MNCPLLHPATISTSSMSKGLLEFLAGQTYERRTGTSIRIEITVDTQAGVGSPNMMQKNASYLFFASGDEVPGFSVVPCLGRDTQVDTV